MTGHRVARTGRVRRDFGSRQTGMMSGQRVCQPQGGCRAFEISSVSGLQRPRFRHAKWAADSGDQRIACKGAAGSHSACARLIAETARRAHCDRSSGCGAPWLGAFDQELQRPAIQERVGRGPVVDCWTGGAESSRVMAGVPYGAMPHIVWSWLLVI
jgi:hypothetical protein